jgi:hypothetical protein
MRFSFDFIVRMAGSQVIEAENVHEAKAKLEALVTSRGGRELVDFEIIKTTSGNMASMTELEDLKEIIKNR